MKVFGLRFLIPGLLLSMISFGQKKIDQSFSYPPGLGFRNYSIYEPSNYIQGEKIKLMVGFHGLDPGKWNGRSWRDTLVDLAESKGFLLVCPDGGSDGRIDESEDYDYTEALLDSICHWYWIDTARTYVIGYGEGAKAVYEYGLNHHNMFKGFIPIAAVINGTDFVSDVIIKAKCKNYYIIHGQQDKPGQRYHPIRDALVENNAKVNSIFMAAVGHTFNFPGRSTILSNAYNYIDTAECDYTGIREISDHHPGNQTTCFVAKGDLITIPLPSSMDHVQLNLTVINLRGEVVSSVFGKYDKFLSFSTVGLESGMYFLRLENGINLHMVRLIVQ